MIENPERVEEREEMERLLYGPSNAQSRAGRTGAASELVVCVDLIRRGYDVFRAVSAQCCCDLIAVKGINVLRVEVRTAHGTKGMSASKRGHYDVLAVVREFNVSYKPTIS
jgi:hypothetical protein